MIKTKWTKWGLASRVGDTIYLSKDLEKDEILMGSIIQHELEHSNSFIMKDIVNDFKGNHLQNVKGRYWNFVISHPKTWTQFLPLWFYERQPSIDITLLIVWFFGIIISWKIVPKIM